MFATNLTELVFYHLTLYLGDHIRSPCADPFIENSALWTPVDGLGKPRPIGCGRTKVPEIGNMNFRKNEYNSSE